MKSAIVAISALVLTALSGAARAETDSNESTIEQVGYGAGSALGTLVYAPFKASFCILGGIASVFALPFGTDTAQKVVDTSCRGTWVITPEVVRGRETLRFVGTAGPAQDAAMK